MGSFERAALAGWLGLTDAISLASALKMALMAAAAASSISRASMCFNIGIVPTPKNEVVG